jgi:L,D-transpeptidase ErfK/SrfK
MNRLFLFFILIPSFSHADIIIGGEDIYHVVKGDTIEIISSRLGLNQKRLIADNNIDIKKPLQIGQELKVNNRKIVPKIIEDGIIINIPDRTLYFFRKGKLQTAFPVGLGMPSWRGLTQWRTPVGEFEIIEKKKNPTWYVPESMQWKMEMEGKPVKTVVLPGPDNPLGRYAMKTSISGIVIHETIWPTSVYQFRSHGCIRVLPDNMEKFFNEVEIGTSGELIYNPVKLAVIEGRVFLEVHKDIYGKIKNLEAEAIRLIEEKGVVDSIDWEKMDMMLDEKSGIAEDITL